MDRGNVNPTQHFPWSLRETTKRTPVILVSTGIWTRNSTNMNPVWWISIGAMLCAFKNFTTDRTSQSAGAGIRACVFNRCNDATVRTREVPLVHASCDVITLSPNKWFTIEHPMLSKYCYVYGLLQWVVLHLTPSNEKYGCIFSPVALFKLFLRSCL